MTAQIGDIYKYQNKEYSIVALSAKNPFHPKMYGMEPHPSSTACYRGYWCEYAIQDDELVLKNLFLFNKDGNYPSLNGIEPLPQEFFEYEGYSGKKKGKQKFVRPKYYGHRLYREINLPISYTGKILLGDGFISEYYIHMGYQRGWAYRRLIELVFEEGLLMETNDLSHLAKAQREAMKQRNVNPRYPDEGNIPQFVEDSFSLGYPEKAWWIE